MVLQKS